MFPALLIFTPLSVIYHIIEFTKTVIRPFTGSTSTLQDEKKSLLNGSTTNGTTNGNGMKKTSGPHGAYHDPLAPASPLFQKIIADQISMALGPAAVLLQIAHPAVGRGVEENSSFTTRPVERGRRSLAYIYTQALGTEEERRYITDATHRSHAKVKKDGDHGKDGKGYNANDPEAQLWVAATMYWSLITGYEDCYGRFDDATQEQLLHEFSVYATALRVPPSMWPKTTKEFEAYWDSMISKLNVTPGVAGVAHDVLYPKNMPFGYKLYLSINGPISRIVTTEKLPREVADMYKLHSTPWTRGVYNFALQFTRMWWPWQMPAIRNAMSTGFMKDMRDRRAKGMKW